MKEENCCVGTQKADTISEKIDQINDGLMKANGMTCVILSRVRGDVPESTCECGNEKSHCMEADMKKMEDLIYKLLENLTELDKRL